MPKQKTGAGSLLSYFFGGQNKAHTTDQTKTDGRRGVAANNQGFDAQMAALAPKDTGVKAKPTEAEQGKATEADPAKEQEKAAGPFEVPRGQVTFDQEGLENPGGRFHSRIPHWPGTWSGVTIGRGYDMKERTRASVKADLLAAGVDEATAATLSAGAGLKGKTAKAFAWKHRGLSLTPEQQKNLFDVSYMEKHAYATRLLTKWTGTSLAAADPIMQDLLVDLFFRGDMTYRKWKAHNFKSIVESNNFRGLKNLLSTKSLWGNVDANRYNARLKVVGTAVDNHSLAPKTSPRPVLRPTRP